MPGTWSGLRSKCFFCILRDTIIQNIAQTGAGKVVDLGVSNSAFPPLTNSHYHIMSLCVVTTDNTYVIG